MTTTTPETIALPAEGAGRRRFRPRLRFGVAFGDRASSSRVIRGMAPCLVRPAVRRSGPARRLHRRRWTCRGSSPRPPRRQLESEYGDLSEGELVLAGPDGPITIPYAELGRRADIDATTPLKQWWPWEWAGQAR